MKKETNMAYIHRKPLTTIAAAFIFMSFTSHTVANIVGPVNDGSPSLSSNPEIISVTGDRPLSFFRKQFQTAELEFFDTLNSYIEKEEFKIECNYTGSSAKRLSLRTCEPKYVDVVEAELVDFSLNAGSQRNIHQTWVERLPSKRKVEQKLEKKRKEHLSLIRTLVIDNASLKLKLLNLNKAKDSFEQKRIEVFGERWVSAQSSSE